MSVHQKTLKKTGVLSEIGSWEFHPDFGPLKGHFNTHDRKGNLKRKKNFITSKLFPTSMSRSDLGTKCAESQDNRKLDRRKLRNAKELENCRTARSHSANSMKDNKQGKCEGTVRTRSMSPTPSTPPLNAELPLRKFYSYCEKIIDQFELVKIFISRQSDAGESLLEINRQQKRATEFAVRFSRNNLYQMKRLVNEIKKIIVPYPFDNLAKSDSEILCKKILLACQAATQALQTYINYMKSGSSLDVPEKTRELILLILDLYLCCEHLSLTGDQLNIQNSCKELIVLLDVKIAEAKGKMPVIKLSEKVRETEKEDNRFSMYKTKLTNSTWKKKTEALAKIKFGVPKISQLKRMKKREESAVVPKATFEIYSQKMHEAQVHKKNSKPGLEDNTKATKHPTDATINTKKFHFTPREVTSQDDDIETVVQSIEDEEAVVSNRTFAEPVLSGKALLENGQTYLNSNVHDLVLQTIQEIQISEKTDVKKSLQKLLKNLNYPANAVHSVSQRNVKLLHIVSNEPIPEEPEEISQSSEEQEKAKVKETEHGIKIEHTSRQEGENNKRKNVFRPIKNSNIALISNGRKYVKITKELSNIIIKYKKMLYEYRKNNVMYKKGLSIKPCELVSRISDQIINDVLLEISSGLENENLIKHLYYSELLEAV